MSDISGNNTRRTTLRDVSGNSINSMLYSIVNEMLNGIEDDEIQDSRDFNPFLYRRRRGNYTIGRSVDSTSPLFNMINQIFDTSRNSQFQNTNQNDTNQNQDNQETNDDESVVEQITFQVTYPLNVSMNSRTSTSSMNNSSTNNNMNNMNNVNNRNNQINSNMNNFGSTINSMVSNSIITAFDADNSNLLNSFLNRPFGVTTRSYYSNTPYAPFDTFSSGSVFQQILSQSLYDESVYKKKISEKGKTQLTHIRFDKDNKDNINTSCPIMQTDFEQEQYLIQLPCNHMFIPEAINRWLDEKPECPVCRFQLDSIEVKREIENTPQPNLVNSPIMRPLNSTYNNRYRHTRQMGRDRIQLNDNSYLDYLYEEIDNNDFQRALILSYRELVDSSGNGSRHDEVDSSNNQLESSSSDTNDTNETNTVEIFESVSAYISDNMPDILSQPDSEITEPSTISDMSDDSDDDNSSDRKEPNTSYYADDDY